jgi:hypothetical protein
MESQSQSPDMSHDTDAERQDNANKARLAEHLLAYHLFLMVRQAAAIGGNHAIDLTDPGLLSALAVKLPDLVHSQASDEYRKNEAMREAFLNAASAMIDSFEDVGLRIAVTLKDANTAFSKISVTPAVAAFKL